MIPYQAGDSVIWLFSARFSHTAAWYPKHTHHLLSHYSTSSTRDLKQIDIAGFSSLFISSYKVPDFLVSSKKNSNDTTKIKRRKSSKSKTLEISRNDNEYILGWDSRLSNHSWSRSMFCWGSLEQNLSKTHFDSLNCSFHWRLQEERRWRTKESSSQIRKMFYEDRIGPCSFEVNVGVFFKNHLETC